MDYYSAYEYFEETQASTEIIETPTNSRLITTGSGRTSNQPNRKKQQVKNSLAKEEKSDPKQKSFENREFNLDKSPAAMMAKMKAKADEMKAMQAMCGF